jgi:hypothetical protein
MLSIIVCQLVVTCESDWKGEDQFVSLLEPLLVYISVTSDVVAYVHVYVSSFSTTIKDNSLSLEHGPTAIETARPTVL